MATRPETEQGDSEGTGGSTGPGNSSMLLSETQPGSSSIDPLVGRALSHYRLDERLGAGGMGVLYRATDLKLGRAVAVKLLARHLITDETAKARFGSPATPNAFRSAGVRRSVLAAMIGAIVAFGVGGLYLYLQHRSSNKVKSLVVLPFVNVTANPDAEYLSDGIADGLINSFSQIPELRVCQDAIEGLKEARLRNPSSPLILGPLAYAYAVSGNKDDALGLVQELKSAANTADDALIEIPGVYVGLDDKEQAFEWLEKACQRRVQKLRHLKIDFRYDPLRSDPRFKDLQRRVGLPP